MEAILEPLIRSPRFLGYLDELNELGRREAEARCRFRQTLDEDVREEFINGEVIVQMTVRDHHMLAVRNIGRVLSLFVETRELGQVRTEQALTGFTRNDYAPDICFWTASKTGKFPGVLTVFPVPDFIVEVLSPSTESRDRGVKFEDFAGHGVGEYWIIDPEARIIEQYLLGQGIYELAGKFTGDFINSTVISGLHMPVAAAFDDLANRAAVCELLA